jgi:hypothetical protein
MKHSLFAGAFVVALLAAVAIPTAAHHSFAAAYLLEEVQPLRGTVLNVAFREPHVYVHVNAPDHAGAMQRWSLEWRDVTTLAAAGITHATLRPGDQVEVIGHPGRNPETHQLLIVRISRLSDGWRWGGESLD